jgi:hypothetical protein
MNVVNVPQPANHALYDEAMTRYADMVRPRAISVYRLGHVRYPGLSDIELLVVTNRTGFDNRYYFSALHRLPQRYCALFAHEPFILPAWSLRVMQYTTHRDRALLAGHDSLHAYSPNDSSDERWCRMLESYCAYAAFIARTKQSEMLTTRMVISAASAFRYVLEDAAQLFAPFDAHAYGSEIDAIRTRFFAREDREPEVLGAWNLLLEHFDRFDAALRSWFDVHDTTGAAAKARALLRGEEPCAAFDREYAFRRGREIDGYFQELASLGFPYGNLFHSAAHPGGLRQPHDTPVVTNLVRNFYRVRRRLTEYAARA